MYKMIRTQTRPSVSVPFFSMEESEDISQEAKTNFEVNYVLTGKFLTVVQELSEDELTLTVSTYWHTKEDLDAYKIDPLCVGMQQVANDYFTEVGITAETVSESEITL